METLKKEMEALQKAVTKYEANEQKDDEQITVKIQQLDAAKAALDVGTGIRRKVAVGMATSMSSMSIGHPQAASYRVRSA